MRPHPLFAFRSRWDLTLPEAAEFFDLHESTLAGYEHRRYPTPEWLSQWLDDPMMSEDEIRRRVIDARRKASLKAERPPAKRNSRGRWNPVREWRKKKGLTQVKAAKILGVATTTVTAWELGDRTVPEHIMRRIEHDES